MIRPRKDHDHDNSILIKKGELKTLCPRMYNCSLATSGKATRFLTNKKMFYKFEVGGGRYSYEKIQDSSDTYDYSWWFYGTWWNFRYDTSIAYRK